MELTDIYRTFHPNTKEYTLFTEPQGIFSKIDHILGHKACLNRDKKIEATTCIFSDYHKFKLDINNRKLTNSWKLHSSLLNKK